ncbi:hypothetical protein [Bifidobacterium sp. SO1]|uniref:hypothetical protein n=1 Tax=Bifidobacterium sp. SO1 TaxID=2809029 RepID=UPI001BDBE658|nr:hypothetical protein [Bifidobacterium sp. SO1]MBT1162195.1 hypothetical protein [Bifidobacterium sp. SO1]
MSENVETMRVNGLIGADWVTVDQLRHRGVDLSIVAHSNPNISGFDRYVLRNGIPVSEPGTCRLTFDREPDWMIDTYATRNPIIDSYRKCMVDRHWFGSLDPDWTEDGSQLIYLIDTVPEIMEPDERIFDLAVHDLEETVNVNEPSDDPEKIRQHRLLWLLAVRLEQTGLPDTVTIECMAADRPMLEPVTRASRFHHIRFDWLTRQPI